MRIVARTGNPDLAMVYVAEDEAGRRLEFVESLEPPHPRDEKWVNIISTLWGCPMQCRFCDAGLQYKGRISAAAMLEQIDLLVRERYPGRRIPCNKWKIQFARMGEPAFNREVLRVLRELPELYDAPGLLPSLSTIAPRGCGRFFAELLRVKLELYRERFQFQFSIHSTNPVERRALIPAETWEFAEMATFGEKIYGGVGRKTTLNFALGMGITADAQELRRWFPPESFLIKLTPMNPTQKAKANGFCVPEDPEGRVARKAVEFRDAGYEVIESVGELEENGIGSNCGQYLAAAREVTVV